MSRLAVLDLETDPFEHGRLVKPFLSGFYDGDRLVSYWGKDCIDALVNFLRGEESCTIYAHNGGRFDFYFFLSHLSHSDMHIINGRIVSASLVGHELRDSFAIMPFALKDYKKDEIDYGLMEECRREDHRDEIMKYFRQDLHSLYELVTAFHKEFGDKLTIGSASIRELKKKCPYDCGGKEYDEKFRKPFYFGGRNQVFRPGLTEGAINIIDVNSMYPFVMSKMLHPIGTVHEVSKSLKPNTVFVVCEGHNHGAFPTRTKAGLNFTNEYGTYCVTRHEFDAAEETGTFRTAAIHKCFNWVKRADFESFVSHFFDARRKASSDGDQIRKLFYKFVLNSAYGKFAQNPDNYYDWYLTAYGEHPPDWHECGKGCDTDCLKRWETAYVFELTYMIWKRRILKPIWYNVATGASITGAARSVLLRGLCATVEPLYCDTDSIIYRGTTRLAFDDSGLGGWKHEASGRVAAIAGKKLYAVFDPDVERVRMVINKGEADKNRWKEPELTSAGALVKKAHKGARLTGSEILRITRGETVEKGNPVPTYRWDGTSRFISRKIKRTA